jgi:SAM-dependent methyltransferase
MKTQNLLETINLLSQKHELDFEKLSKINLELSPTDNMFEADKEGAILHYIKVGIEALAVIEKARSLVKMNQVGSILDFGCGYGRVLRYLKSYYKDSKITCSEIEPTYVTFCKDTFDVEGYTSSTNFNELETKQKHDIIWSGSVFTHLSSNKFKELFNFFENSLNEDGIMVFTTHGRFCEKHLKSHGYGLTKSGVLKTRIGYSLSGYGYSDYDFAKGYGVSINTLDWFTKFISKKSNLRLITYYEKYWDDHQDVIVVQKKPV